VESVCKEEAVVSIKVPAWCLLGGTEKDFEATSQATWSSGQEKNIWPPQYYSESLSHRTVTLRICLCLYMKDEGLLFCRCVY